MTHRFSLLGRLAIVAGLFCGQSTAMAAQVTLSPQALAFGRRPPAQQMLQADSQVASVHKSVAVPRTRVTPRKPSKIAVKTAPHRVPAQQAATAQPNNQWQAIQPAGTYQDASLTISKAELGALQRQAQPVSTGNATQIQHLADQLSQLAIQQDKLKQASVSLTKLVVKLLKKQAQQVGVQQKPSIVFFSVAWWKSHNAVDIALWAALSVLLVALLIFGSLWSRQRQRTRLQKQLQGALLPDVILSLAESFQRSGDVVLVKALCRQVLSTGSADQKSQAAVLLAECES